MDELNIVNALHTATERDYLDRVNSVDKAWAAEKALNWGYDYWDGSRQTGYGGYKYDGRWKTVADQLIEKYKLKDGAKINIRKLNPDTFPTYEPPLHSGSTRKKKKEPLTNILDV